MIFAIKKQLNDYQTWINIASTDKNDIIKTISRYDFITFLFVFSTCILTAFIVYNINLNLTLVALALHIFLGINILKARAIVANSLDKLIDHKDITPSVARFLNREYSLFLVSQGKNPLTDEQIENLEVHKKTFVKNNLTRGGRGDSIRRFRLAFLNREKNFFNILFGVLVVVEFFVIF